MNRKMFSTSGVPIFLAAILAATLPVSLATTQSDPPHESRQSSASPLKLDEVIDLIKKTKKDPAQLSYVLTQRGVDFDLDTKTEKKLRKAGADDDTLYGIWQITPNGKAHMKVLLTTPTGVELQVASSEALAFQDIQNETDPERRLRLINEFEKNFPSSPLLSYAYTTAAKTHEESGDFEAALNYGEKSLKLDPDNTFALVAVALALPQPKMLNGRPEEVRARLSEAAASANRALTLLEKLPRQTAETDDQFQQRKNSIAADAHFALGMVEMQEDRFDRAVAQYKTAISLSVKPGVQNYYRLAEAYASEGQIAEAIEALQEASRLGRGTPMEKYANDFIAELRRKTH
jgi:tetratricopeptide (TPR) repeat protein